MIMYVPAAFAIVVAVSAAVAPAVVMVALAAPVVTTPVVAAVIIPVEESQVSVHIRRYIQYVYMCVCVCMYIYICVYQQFLSRFSLGAGKIRWRSFQRLFRDWAVAVGLWRRRKRDGSLGTFTCT